MRFLILAVLLAGCGGPNLPDTTYWMNRGDQLLVDEVFALWRAVEPEHADLSQCEEERLRVRISVVGDDQFPSFCEGYCNPGNCPGFRASEGCRWGCAGDCFSRHSFGGPLSSESIVIFLHERVLEPGGVGGPEWTPWVRHGLAHWVSSCAGGNEDSGHTGPIWRAIGFR